MLKAGICAVALIGLASAPAMAHGNQVDITVRGDQRCISSNDTPTHAIGHFPTRGNPNSFRAQNISVCVDATPSQTGRVTTQTNASGITLSGIPIRPGTAECYDPTGRGGFSRNCASGWHVEGLANARKLGMDANDAHVDERGLYHYHGVSNGLLEAAQGTLIGYAADGFEIHYAGGGVQSSYELKQGTRPSGPGGRYDGSYIEDWTYTAGAGDLDECNGGIYQGHYVYFATDTYPFFPRCFKGTVSRDFLGRP
ncbi:MAG: YHYH protein [Maritimibacter sp.]